MSHTRQLFTQTRKPCTMRKPHQTISLKSLGQNLSAEVIATMAIKDAMRFLEEEYNLFLEGHTSYISCIAITSDSKYIVSSGCDCTVRIWNLKDKTQEAVLKGHTSLVSTVAITSDNKYIVSAGDIL